MEKMEVMDSWTSWEEEARAIQQAFYLDFGDRDWDRYDTAERHLLRNVGFAVYGPPNEEPDEAANLATGYSKEKLNHIVKLCEKLQQQDADDGKIDIGIIYVVLKLEDNPHFTLPVFRIPKGKLNIFIDTSPDGRVYEGWDKYLANNRLPKGSYCYPSHGVYYGDADDNVIIDISTTPASKLSRRLLNGADNVGTVVSVGTTILTVAALATPVASSVLLAAVVSEIAVGLYSAGRSITSIVDRKQHQQSISVTDAESRGVYIGLVASALGMAATGAANVTARLASRGKLLTTAEHVIVNATRVGSITANGIGIVNTLVLIKEKSKSGEPVTSLEIFQLTSAILFFTHSVVSFKSAKKIVRETQQDVIKSFESQLASGRKKRGFQRATRNTRKGLDAMNGDAKIIRSLSNVENANDFFRVTRPVQTVPHTTTGSMNLGDVVVDGVALFAWLPAGLVPTVLGLMSRCITKDVVIKAAQLAHKLGFTYAQDFMDFLDFASGRIDEILNDMLRTCVNGCNNLRYSSSQGCYDHCLDLIYNLYSVGLKCSELLVDYQRHKEALRIRTLSPEPTSQLTTVWSPEWTDPSPITDEPMKTDWNYFPQPESDAVPCGQLDSKPVKTRREAEESLCLDRDFDRCGLLSTDEIYILAAMATGREATRYNAAIDHLDDAVAVVTIMDPNEEDRLVLISSDVYNNVILIKMLD